MAKTLTITIKLEDMDQVGLHTTLEETATTITLDAYRDGQWQPAQGQASGMYVPVGTWEVRDE